MNTTEVLLKVNRSFGIYLFHFITNFLKFRDLVDILAGQRYMYNVYNYTHEQ